MIAAGLIPEEMADLLEISQHNAAGIKKCTKRFTGNAAGIKKRTKRFTGARDLTAEDYREMLVED